MLKQMVLLSEHHSFYNKTGQTVASIHSMITNVWEPHQPLQRLTEPVLAETCRKKGCLHEAAIDVHCSALLHRIKIKTLIDLQSSGSHRKYELV